MDYRAFNEDEPIEDVIPLGDGREIAILRPRDADALLDEHAFAADEFIAYWADLWPSAILLARTLAGRSLRGTRILELGCGLALPSLAAAQSGARILATDWSEDAVRAARRNAAHNAVAIDTLRADWREPETLLARGPFDLVIAADVLYEQRNTAPVAAILDALGTETWLADPGRPPAAACLAELELAGWTHSTLARTRRPAVEIHRLLPGRMYE